MTSRLESAIQFAIMAHSRQSDKVGNPYIIHPIMVMVMGRDNESAQIVNVLHDVEEDTNFTLDDIDKAVHLLSDEREALRLLKHNPHEPYIDYIQRIKESENQLAIDAKITDIHHNMNRNMDKFPQETQDRLLKKYKMAQSILKYQWHDQE